MPAPTPHRRADYPTMRLPITTRWMDNDVYGHVNNVVYYSYFDTVINAWLIERGGLDIANGDCIGLCVESRCSYLRPLAYPQTVEAGLRVVHLGRSSVRYEIAIFASGGGVGQGDSDANANANDDAAAQGEFVHVFVDRKTRRPMEMPPQLRAALAALLVPTTG